MYIFIFLLLSYWITPKTSWQEDCDGFTVINCKKHQMIFRLYFTRLQLGPSFVSEFGSLYCVLFWFAISINQRKFVIYNLWTWSNLCQQNILECIRCYFLINLSQKFWCKFVVLSCFQQCRVGNEASCEMQLSNELYLLTFCGGK